MPDGAVERRSRAGRVPRISNRDRILETSLELFNERGVPAVSTKTIAAHLAISPGNLYYYFANKEQIVRELWSQVEDLAAVSTVVPEDGSLLPPEGLAAIFGAAIDAIQRFRFVFRDTDELVARDPEFARAFRSDMARERGRLIALFDSLIEHGVMLVPSDRRDVERLSANVQMFFFNWIGFVTTTRGQATVSAADIAEGGMRSFVMVEPHLERDYAARARVVLERRLRDTEDAARLPKAAKGPSRSRRQ